MMRSSLGTRMLVLLLLSGCADGGDEVPGEGVETAAISIIEGSLASGFPEAAYLDIDPSELGMYVCSGTLISSRVVLTAGHCVDEHDEWHVHVGDSYSKAVRSAVYDWDEEGSSGVNPLHHDIGLVFLDNPIEIGSFPTMAHSPLIDGSRVTCVGRVVDGDITSQLYQNDVDVEAGDTVGYPLDYASDVIIQAGDSGGPVFRHQTHEIVAVNSGVGGDVQVLARVDLIVDWIELTLEAEASRAMLSNPRSTAIGGRTSSSGQPENGDSAAQRSANDDEVPLT